MSNRNHDEPTEILYVYETKMFAAAIYCEMFKCVRNLTLKHSVINVCLFVSSHVTT